MKAVYRYGTQPLQSELREIPKPICGDDDVLLRVKAAAICGSDVGSYFNGGEKGGIGVSGHEFAGEVAEVGKNVTDWRPGDRVVSDNTGHVCGKCRACTTGHFLECVERKGIGYGMDGGFAEYVRIPGEVLAVHKWALMKIPDNVPYEYAAMLDPVCNAYKAVAQSSGLLPGEDAIVFGPGPIGLLAVQFCRMMGAGSVALVGLQADKQARQAAADAMGATAFIASDTEDLDEAIRRICGREGPRVAIDCAGAPAVLRQAMGNVQKGGIIVKVGVSAQPLDFSLSELTLCDITLKGHHAYDVTSWRNCLALLEKERLCLSPLITHRLPLEEWEKGMHMMRDRVGIKIILTP